MLQAKALGLISTTEQQQKNDKCYFSQISQKALLVQNRKHFRPSVVIHSYHMKNKLQPLNGSYRSSFVRIR